MCVDLVSGKQANFVQLVKTCEMHKRNFCWDQKKKNKTGGEYIYYIPREITLSLSDCEPLQWTPRGWWSISG